MDVSSYLRRFEGSLSSYTGDDPLEPWDRFVAYLEQKLPGGMSQVLDALVQRFLSEERYANDARYVDYCIRCAAFYSDPAALLAHVNARGVGATSAALYVAWARQLEQSGRHQEAEAVFQSAASSRAQPADAVLGEHRLFLARTKHQTAASRSSPLQNSLLPNRQRVSGGPGLGPAAGPLLQEDCPQKPAAYKTTVSRSENCGAAPSSRAVATVSAYLAEQLLCEGAELCFEEARALRYFRRQEAEAREKDQKELSKVGGAALSYRGNLEDFLQGMETSPGSAASPVFTQQPLGRPPAASCRRSLGSRSRGESAFRPEAEPQGPSAEVSHHAPHPAHEGVHPEASAPSDHESADQTLEPRPVVQNPQELTATCQEDVQPEEKLNVSQGASANLSHFTPNSSSLGLAPPTPSRTLPSPTVNTREALDVIMDMFQAPTLLEDPLSRPSMLHSSLSDFLPGGSCLARSSAPLAVFQDEPDKENAGPIRARAPLLTPSANKPNEAPVDPPPDETLWGPRSSSLDACPNSTKDFNMLAHFVSTPFTHKAPFCFYEGDPGDGEEVDVFLRRQTKKLSPIMELSPSGDAFARLLPAPAAHGTIVGEGVAPPPHGLTCSSITLVEAPPPAALSFRDQTSTGAAAWDVYESPEPAPPPGPRREAFTIMEDMERGATPMSPERGGATPMSPEPGATPMSPERGGPTSPEPGATPMSPERGGATPMSPERGGATPMSPEPGATPMSPERGGATPMSPERGGQALPGAPVSPGRPQPGADVPMSPAPLAAEDEASVSADVSLKASRGARGPLLSDPWDPALLSRLLAALSPPLAAHPRCVSWPCKLPAIRPKTTIRMGRASLRVDCVLGEGAFATVYQATDPETSERTVLKVQKPANPWEFYVNVQLDARLQPDVRRLFGAVSSAHLFQDGSVLLGELHNHGTLLNAVNIYKTMSDKVMPQPLVMYFAVCILHMVEQLHAVQVVHADIKPDNFLLGDRFLDSRSVGPEELAHGLVLVDLGQSIDMRLFPEGTAFTARCLTSGFQCTEMLSGKPWSYQTDFFGVAGTVHCLLFGTYMQVKQEAGVWTTNGVFRRNPHSELWHDFFHFLLNAPGGAAPLGLRSLRRSLAAALQQNYGAKLPALKSRMMVLLLENRRAAPRR